MITFWRYGLARLDIRLIFRISIVSHHPCRVTPRLVKQLAALNTRTELQGLDADFELVGS